MLSRRLETIVSMCGSGRCVADIGTDHGFVPIELLRRGCFERAIAMDIRSGPLSRAEEHIRERGLADRAQVRLSDGMEKLAQWEADTVVIAGMGGGLMAEILAAKPETAKAAERLVLSPQSDIPEFRRFLHRSGFCILQEEMLLEDGKTYVVMAARPGTEEPWEEAEYTYGKDLILGKHPVLLERLHREIRADEELAEHLRKGPGERTKERLLEVEAHREMAEKVLSRMERIST